jgi:Fe2+ or Zn2+ uptake regulation protein
MGEPRISIAPGRPKDGIVDEAILGAVMENRALSAEAIRRIISKKVNRQVSWTTVNRHLIDLEQRGMVKRHVFGRFRTKTTQLITMPHVSFV